MVCLEDRLKEALGPRILSWHRHAPRRAYCSIAPETLREAVKILFRDLECRFSIASGTQLPDGFEILYHFSHDPSGEIVTLRVYLGDPKNPEIDSLATLFPGAEWIEREMWELLGIQFRGHPNLKRLLLADDWPEGNFPLRRQDG